MAHPSWQLVELKEPQICSVNLASQPAGTTRPRLAMAMYIDPCEDHELALYSVPKVV